MQIINILSLAGPTVLPFALLIPVGILTLAWWRESARSARWRGVLDAFAERELAAAGQESALSVDALSETRGPSHVPGDVPEWSAGPEKMAGGVKGSGHVSGVPLSGGQGTRQ
jgi:hypothetical protein